MSTESTCGNWSSSLKQRSCIEALAAGWINPPDLCPACTRAFMSALDWVAEPVKLSWHANYIERAGTREGVPS